ncbi:MAG: alpha/beta fold hydrolase [Rhodospirillaceae bacterium]|nr:alpha/beta fold hydrolase [Rhodospirillaceae bacterium]
MHITGPAAQLPFPPFRQRFPWIGGDLQTLRNTLRRAQPNLSGPGFERLRLPCEDGTGDVLLAALNTPAEKTTRPLVMLIHGLTGCEDSRHILFAAQHFLSLGYPVLRLNLRGAGPSRATCQGHYHAGRSEDIAAALTALPNHLIAHGVCLMGVSLGGNVVLKFLAEFPGFAEVKAAVAVSPPIDLAASQRCIMRPRNVIYHRYLINRMKEGVQNSGLATIAGGTGLHGIRTVYDFDDRIVAPANGFEDAPDYYRRCSAFGVLDAIATPTLIIHPQDDPWVPAAPLLLRVWPSDSPVTVLSPEHGGHIGCHGTGNPMPWHNLCAGIFFGAA